jgi:CxxC motif-containing protein (DUF1111 family)
MRAKRVLLCGTVVFVTVVATAWAGDPEWAGAPDDPTIALGRRLFLRQWMPDDPRGRGGDGLGPVFNERSCVACHGLAGPGGAGTRSVNVELLTAIARGLEAGKTPDRSRLALIHPALAETGSIVLHRFGLAPHFSEWRKHAVRLAETRVPTDDSASQKFTFVISRRNAPALFGAGRLDAIPDAAIEAEAKRQGPEKGRVSRTMDGKIGRFGWKAQVASLDDFVLTACANELGLEVPGHHQASDPHGFGERKNNALDMSADDCAALVAYVHDLPEPVETSHEFAQAGRIVFDRIGCAECHRPRLAGVAGAYTDLLLHDMGPGLSDDGLYYGSSEPSSPGAPKPSEWRTPPLWGVASTGPFLHDGRAPTLSDAIAAHGGAAHMSAMKFHSLARSNQLQLLSFLRSLKVPPASRIGPAHLTRRERVLESAEAAVPVER